MAGRLMAFWKKLTRHWPEKKPRPNFMAKYQNLATPRLEVEKEVLEKTLEQRRDLETIQRLTVVNNILKRRRELR